MQTIAHRKISAKNKSPEITRFVNFLNLKGIGYIELSESTGIPDRTIKNFVWGDLPLSGQLLRLLHQNYSVSVDWLLSGKGEMFMNDSNDSTEHSKVYEQPSFYEQMHGDQRLIESKEFVDNENLADVYYIFAYTIEQALLEAGAEPNHDYSYLDLFKLAQPHVLDEHQKNTLKVQMIYPSDRS